MRNDRGRRFCLLYLLGALGLMVQNPVAAADGLRPVGAQFRPEAQRGEKVLPPEQDPAQRQFRPLRRPHIESQTSDNAATPAWPVVPQTPYYGAYGMPAWGAYPLYPGLYPAPLAPYPPVPYVPWGY